jgi:hypothetical protein
MVVVAFGAIASRRVKGFAISENVRMSTYGTDIIPTKYASICVLKIRIKTGYANAYSPHR